MDLTIDGIPLTAALIEEGAPVELACLPPPAVALRLEVADVVLEPFLRPGDPAWRWRWTAPFAAGMYPLRLWAERADAPAEIIHAQLQVLPRKLDLERYQLLLEDLQACEPALVQALGGGLHPAASNMPPTPAPRSSAEELAALTGVGLDRLFAAVHRLALRPPDRLVGRLQQTSPDRVHDPDRLDLRRLDPAPTGESPREILAASGPLPERRATPTYDSYEHRLLRRLLDGLLRRAHGLAQRTDLPAHGSDRLAEIQSRLRELRRLPFLAEVPPLETFRGPTVRLQREPDWRTVYRAWQELRRRSQISWELPSAQLGVTDLPRLYERWCALQVCLALLKLPGWELEAQALAAVDAGGFEWRLELRDRGPLLRLNGEAGGLQLHYQARYRPPGAHTDPLIALDRHIRVPDLTIEWRRPKLPPCLLILDAKYRLDVRGGVPADAMADAYSYLGGIGNSAGERAVLGVALLYPGAAQQRSTPAAWRPCHYCPARAIHLSIGCIANSTPISGAEGLLLRICILDCQIPSVGVGPGVGVNRSFGW
ncbi:MAG: DUF2357 domain-containing protein [Oscillochloris sp.]|nr:DUF2357 domain-containing protein [Oscillochloris sp.]